MEYKDRSIGLIVFGLLTVCLGCLCGLLILFLVGETFVLNSGIVTAGQGMPGAPKPSIAMLIPAMAVYGMMGIALTWLGIGSIMATRWARALLLVFSWSWLIMGIIMMVVMSVMLPMILNSMPAMPNAPAGSPPPSAFMGVAMVIGLLFDGIVFVLLPGVWTFFYSSRHVKATCEARHPQPAWTDACPLPVLAGVLWLAYSVPMMVVMPATGLGALPFFGTFLTGLSASAGYLLLGVVYAVAAWRLYRLDVRGWWLLVGLICFFLVSGFVTFAQHNVMDMYRAMNLPADQLAAMDKMGFLKSKGILWLSALFCVPTFGYLAYIRRYFRPSVAA
jgi:hypothetical protein